MENQPRGIFVEILWKASLSTAATQLIIIHEAAHVKPPRTRLVLQTQELIDCSDSLWIYLAYLVFASIAIMTGAEQQQGSHVTFLWLTRFSPPSVHLYALSTDEGCACATWTDSDEMNSSERWEWLWRNWKRARANVTIWAWRELHRYVCYVCVCVLLCVRPCTGCSHKYEMGFWEHIYQDVSFFHCACLPGGYQTSISNAAL